MIPDFRFVTVLPCIFSTSQVMKTIGPGCGKKSKIGNRKSSINLGTFASLKPAMSTIRLGDKTFVPYIPEEKILAAVKNVAGRINTDMEGLNPLFLVVLNGSFVFAADLVRDISIPCEVSFVKLASYHGTSSAGAVKELVGLNEDLEGRNVVIVEDIVDSGNTIAHLLDQVQSQRPASVCVASFLFKPEVFKRDFTIKYVGMEIGNDFIVGYGLDYNGLGRNLRDIYVIKP